MKEKEIVSLVGKDFRMEALAFIDASRKLAAKPGRHMRGIEAVEQCLARTRFVDWPLQKTLIHYDQVRQTYIDGLKVDYRSIYQIGSVKAPGVSDLDLFVVIPDLSQSPRKFDDFSIRHLKESDRYIMMHEPWVVNESIFRQLNYLFPVFDLELKAGDPIAPAEDLLHIDRHLALIYACEYVVSKIPRMLIDLLMSRGAMSARFGAVLVNSVRHSVSLFYAAGGEHQDQWDRFFETFDDYRLSGIYQSEHRDTELRRGLACSLEITMQMIEQQGHLCEEVFGAQAAVPVTLSGPFPARFVDSWDPDTAIEQMLEDYTIRPDWLQLPASIGAYWRALSCVGGLVSDSIELDGEAIDAPRLCDSMSSALRRHCAAVEEYLLFSRRRLGYRGSIFVTLGAGDEWPIALYRRVRRYLKHNRLRSL